MHVCSLGVSEVLIELKIDYKSVNISDLCTLDRSIKCFPKGQVLLSFAMMFYLMTKKKNSSFFFDAWSMTMKEARMINSNLSIGDLESEVWIPTFRCCEKFLEELQTFSITLTDVDRKFHSLSEKKVAFEIKQLFCGIMTCQQLVSKAKVMPTQPNDCDWIEGVVERIADYRKLCSYRDAAISFLKLRDSLGISGTGFTHVATISTEVCM